MTSQLTELEEFQDRIEAQFGLVFDAGRREQVQETLLARSSALRLSSRAYLEYLDTEPEEWHQIAELLTIPESYFFRHADHLRAFIEVAVPERLAAHPDHRHLRILCIGCAGGEEPYTLSITLLEHASLVSNWKTSIRGCDINPEVLRKAERGLYTNWSLRATPPSCRNRYFTAVGNRYRITDEVRRSVTFESCNALSVYRPEIAGSIDIIFFRNVLIYFSPEAICAAISSAAHVLAPGGFLFLGPAETLRGVSEDFHLCHTHETFYYRRRESIAPLVRFSPPSGDVQTGHSGGPVLHGFEGAGSPALPFDTAWVAEIERSSERIRGLHAGRGAESPRPPVPQPEIRRYPGEELQRLLALLGSERYDDVVNGIAGLPASLRGDPDLQILLAMAHVNRREIGKAEEVCRCVLERDSMNSAGHYILALCRESVGDLSAAAEHDHTAIYLDDSFAMPHLHLALMARRRGESRQARREFESASLLLGRESSSRLMMFGGGFTREALRNICRRELKALGAA